MSVSTTDNALAQLSELVAVRLGLHFPPERWADLERGVRRAAAELGCEDVESCIQQLVAAPLSKSQIETLARHLTVGETYFWREKQSLQVLQEHILPRLISARRDRPSDQRTIKIWSAGCCTGEEPYSIAMLLSRLIPDRQNWNLTVLATDINTQFLAKAEAGVYREWSFRGAPSWLQEKYFQKTKEGHYQVLPHIRDMVSFATLNLAEDTYPSILNNTHAIDVILCRNVFIYLTAEHTRRVTQNFYRCLVDGGWLIVSPSEASHTLLSQFSTVNFPGTILYQKERHQEGQSEKFPPLGKGRGRVGSEREYSHLTPSPTLPPIKGKGVLPPLATASESTAAPPLEPPAAPASRTPSSTPGEAVLLPSLMEQARAHANDGRLLEALECCERVLAEDKMNPAAHYLHATILQEQGEFTAAAGALKRALYLDNDFVLAHFALGNLARGQGKLKEAQKHFENTLRLLRAHNKEATLPESDGLTAGRLQSIVLSLLPGESARGSTP